MYSIKTGQRPVFVVNICLASTADICPVSAEVICPVEIQDIRLLWGQLGSDENDFDPFFTPKMRKMEHARHCHGNDATGRSAEPHNLARTCQGSPVKLCGSLVASTRAVDREFFLIWVLGELSQSSSRLSETHVEAVHRRTDALAHIVEVENDLDPFFSPKMRKMEHARHCRWSSRSPGNATTGGCVELVLNAPGVRIT